MSDPKDPRSQGGVLAVMLVLTLILFVAYAVLTGDA